MFSGLLLTTMATNTGHKTTTKDAEDILKLAVFSVMLVHMWPRALDTETQQKK